MLGTMAKGPQHARTEEDLRPNNPATGPVAGYGACSTSGCNCRGYEGSGNTCENCGHSYEKHW